MEGAKCLGILCEVYWIWTRRGGLLRRKRWGMSGYITWKGLESDTPVTCHILKGIAIVSNYTNSALLYSKNFLSQVYFINVYDSRYINGVLNYRARIITTTFETI